VETNICNYKDSTLDKKTFLLVVVIFTNTYQTIIVTTPMVPLVMVALGCLSSKYQHTGPKVP